MQMSRAVFGTIWSLWLTTWAVILLTAGLSGISKAEQIFFSDFDGRPLRPFRVAPGVSGEWTRLPDLHTRPIPLFSEQYVLGSLAEAATLKLEGLPPHSSIDLDFLFAALDSWDGSTIEGGRAAPDFFNVSVDGDLVFSETFDFALIDDQSFRPEPRVLAYRVEDFSIAGRFMSVYDMGGQSDFRSIPHSSDTLEIRFFANGAGIQSDERWAIDDLKISIGTPETVGSPVIWAFVLLGIVRAPGRGVRSR